MRPALVSLRQRMPATPTRWLRAGVLFAALAALALGLATRALAGPPQSTPALVGHPAPAFALPSERGGQPQPGTITLASERGHPALLVFFYTLCVHCLSQVQAAQTAAQAGAPQGTRVLYISSPVERPDIVDGYLSRLSVSTPALLDTDGSVAARYHIRFYPTTILVDARGNVRGVWLGESGAEPLERALASLATPRS